MPAFLFIAVQTVSHLVKSCILRVSVFVMLVMVITPVAIAQKQIILLKRGTVIARFTEGETIKVVLKNKKIIEGVAIRFNDFSINTFNDTIPFESIEKINVKGRRNASTLNKVGTVLMIAGVGYFAIDQINTWFFVEGQSGIDENVAITSVCLVATGAALRFIRSPYQKVRGLSMRTIDSTSRYYRYE
jgi:hypothetical protein